VGASHAASRRIMTEETEITPLRDARPDLPAPVRADSLSVAMEEEPEEKERRPCCHVCCCVAILALAVLVAITIRYLVQLFSQPDDPSVKMITVCVRWMPKLCVTGRRDMIPELAFKYKFIHH